YFFKIYINKEEQRIKTDIVPYDLKMKKLEFFYKNIQCEYIDVVDVGNEYELSIVCDDEGLLKSGNVVMDVYHESLKEPFSLAGALLIGKNINTDDGVEIEGFYVIYSILFSHYFIITF